MKKFDVEITETLQRTVTVEAASQEEAERTHYMDVHYSFNITLQTLSTIAWMSES